MSKHPRQAPLWLIPALLVAVWLGASGLNADLIWIDDQCV